MPAGASFPRPGLTQDHKTAQKKAALRHPEYPEGWGMGLAVEFISIVHIFSRCGRQEKMCSSEQIISRETVPRKMLTLPAKLYLILSTPLLHFTVAISHTHSPVGQYFVKWRGFIPNCAPYIWPRHSLNPAAMLICVISLLESLRLTINLNSSVFFKLLFLAFFEYLCELVFRISK